MNIAMSKFWPERSTVVGFSIEKLAKNYRDKLRMNNASLVTDRNESKIIPTNAYCHWANREFSEYF
tara:strand:+ start:558 stop:755 length:198 start_codon:yes stop_codon:yes gene_type:complete